MPQGDRLDCSGRGQMIASAPAWQRRGSHLVLRACPPYTYLVDTWIQRGGVGRAIVGRARGLVVPECGRATVLVAPAFVGTVTCSVN